MSPARPGRSAAAKRAACQTCRGLISPKRKCGDRPDVPSRSGRSRSPAYPATPSSRNASSRAWADVSPGCPCFAQSAGPIRMRRFKTPSSRCASLAMSGAGRSVFGAGRGLGGSPSACTRRQNGVNTRKPRPSLLRMLAGATSRSPGKLCEATPISREAGCDLIGHGLMRRLRDLVPEHGRRRRFRAPVRR